MFSNFALHQWEVSTHAFLQSFDFGEIELKKKILLPLKKG